MGTTRYTIDVDDKFQDTLERLVKETSATTKAEVLRRALATYDLLNERTRDANQQVVIRSGNKETIVGIPK